MPNTIYSDALKEVATLANQGAVMLDAVQISHPSVSPSIFLVNDRESLFARDENNVPQTFAASNFALKPPESSSSGTQFLNLTIPNIDRSASDFMDQVPIDSSSPVVITHYIYISDEPDTQQPQNDPVTILHLTDIQTDVFVMSGRASFQSISNKKYPSELYTLERFPALGN
jgi:hypothetical protein